MSVENDNEENETEWIKVEKKHKPTYLETTKGPAIRASPSKGVQVKASGSSVIRAVDVNTGSFKHDKSSTERLSDGTTILWNSFFKGGHWIRYPVRTVKNGEIVSKKTVAADSTPDVDVGLIDAEGKKRLRKAGSGKVTIDSGAGESVCPINMVPDETLHATSEIGTIYKAAGGQILFNQGEKRIKFRAGQHVGKLHFQAIAEVKKPLASAAKITNKGNLIVLDEDGAKVTSITRPRRSRFRFTRRITSMFSMWIS